MQSEKQKYFSQGKWQGNDYVLSSWIMRKWWYLPVYCEFPAKLLLNSEMIDLRTLYNE